MSYSYKNKTFNLILTKLMHWHRDAEHTHLEGCIYCDGDMEKIAQVLKENGLVVLDVGHA